jgi:hypothetical protein
MSWRAEYADDSGRWWTNGLRFATKKEAEDYVFDMGWTMVWETCVTEVDDPVNYSYHDHQLCPVTQEAKEEEERAARVRVESESEPAQLELPFGREIGRHLAAGRDNDDRLLPSARHTWEHAGKVRLGAGQPTTERAGKDHHRSGQAEKGRQRGRAGDARPGAQRPAIQIRRGRRHLGIPRSVWLGV